MKNSIPLYFYPSLKMIVDDDQIFLQSILLKMHGKNFSNYSSPQKALDYLLYNYKPLLTRYDLFKIDEASTIQYDPLIFINNLFRNDAAQAQKDISVILVDYHMPEMSGIDFLKKISHLPMKKILITGEQDYTIAINAFNNRLVDAYIRKEDTDFSTKIQQVVASLEWQYFVDLGVAAYDIPDMKYLTNNFFIEEFRQFIIKENIISFFLSDKKGTFIMHDTQGRKKIFILREKTQIQELSKLAEDDGASHETVQKLAEAKVIPFFGHKEHWEIPAIEWENFLYPTNLLKGDSNFIWTSISNNNQALQE